MTRRVTPTRDPPRVTRRVTPTRRACSGAAGAGALAQSRTRMRNEEFYGARLFTGPMYLKYNATLRYKILYV